MKLLVTILNLILGICTLLTLDLVLYDLGVNNMQPTNAQMLLIIIGIILTSKK